MAVFSPLSDGPCSDKIGLACWEKISSEASSVCFKPPFKARVRAARSSEVRFCGAVSSTTSVSFISLVTMDTRFRLRSTCTVLDLPCEKLCFT